MIAIGFAEKMFTLWECIEHENFTTYTYTYVKNISADKSVVESLYPGITIDYSLKGHSTIIATKGETRRYEVGVFPFGKYKGMKITECADYSYLDWIY